MRFLNYLLFPHGGSELSTSFGDADYYIRLTADAAHAALACGARWSPFTILTNYRECSASALLLARLILCLLQRIDNKHS